MERETKIVLTIIGINLSVVLPLLLGLGIIIASIIWGLEILNFIALTYFEQLKVSNTIKTQKTIEA